MPDPRRLILFDIDGTLLRTSNAGMDAIKAAMLSVYGAAGSIGQHIGGGRNYRLIVGEALEETSVTPQQFEAGWEEFNHLVILELKRLVETQPERFYALPGCLHLVETLTRRRNAVLGLITGNPSVPSTIKLRAAGYTPANFLVNVFGDEAPTRAELVELARRRAVSLLGYAFPGSQTVVIGDTVADVVCARLASARVLIALTGDSPRSAFAANLPDCLFPDLSDTRRVIDAIFAAL